jgi:hypothetical protein
MSLRRRTLERMGGFDVALDVGSVGRGGGDLDIMAAASATAARSSTTPARSASTSTAAR